MDNLAGIGKKETIEILIESCKCLERVYDIGRTLREHRENKLHRMRKMILS